MTAVQADGLSPTSRAQPLPSTRRLAMRTAAAMESDRETMIPWWEELARYFSPRAPRINPSDENRGNALNRHLIHEEALFARRTLTSGLHWGITNPSRRWMEFGMPDPDLAENAAVKAWLHVLNERYFMVLGGSNFYEVQSGAYDEVGVYATSAYLVEEDARDVVRFVPLAVGSYAIADDERREVTAFCRTFTMTLRQLVNRFGVDPVTRQVTRQRLARFSKAAAKAYEAEDWGAKFVVQHLVEPNPDADSRRDAPDAWAYRSLYWEKDATPQGEGVAFLAEEGYREFPLVVFRWQRVADEPWGIDCPGMMTLGSNKSLQVMESKGLKLLAKVVDPPTVGPGALSKRRTPSTLPGAHTAVDDRDRQLRAVYEVKAAALDKLELQKDKVIARVHDLWFTKLMLLVANDARASRATATEIEAASQEKYLVLGSVLEAFNGSFSRMADRVYAIMDRRGLIPPAPEALQGRTLVPVYTSIMAIAMKAVGLGNLERFASVIANLTSVLPNERRIPLKVDWAQLIDELEQRSALPPGVVRTDAEVETIERAAAEAAAEERRTALAVQEAEAAKKMAETPTTGDTVLAQVLRASQGSLAGMPRGGVS